MDFKNVIFVSDLDGTLFTDDKKILRRDMAAIERFRRGGGLFSAATGRGIVMAKRAADELKIDIPAVLFNGAGVYDFSQKKFLWQCEIGARARGYIEKIIGRFPDLGIEILHNDAVFVPFLNAAEQAHLDMESVKPVRCGLYEIPDEGWLKFVIAEDPKKLDEVQKFVENSEKGVFEGANFVRSAPQFYECLPQGVDKSRGFEELVKILHAEKRFKVAAGDFMNDKAMIEKADLGAAVANAEREVREAADIVVCDNNSGAAAEIIEYIERL